MNYSIDPNVRAQIVAAQEAMLTQTGTAIIRRNTVVKNPDGLGTIKGSPTVLGTGVPCRVVEKTSVVDTIGGTAKTKVEYLVTLPAEWDLDLGDLIDATVLDGRTVSLTVTRHPVGALGTAQRVYCEIVEGA